MKTAKFSDGTIVRIDHVIRGQEVQVNYSDVDSPIRNQSCKTMPSSLADRWLDGKIVIMPDDAELPFMWEANPNPGVAYYISD